MNSRISPPHVDRHAPVHAPALTTYECHTLSHTRRHRAALSTHRPQRHATSPHPLHRPSTAL